MSAISYFGIRNTGIKIFGFLDINIEDFRFLVRSDTCRILSMATPDSKSQVLQKRLKELTETAVWLDLIVESSLISRERVYATIVENREIGRIIAASIKTAEGFERSHV
jgi:hypothetical protein